MARHPFGWNLPPGVTQRHIDEAIQGDEPECEMTPRYHVIYKHGRAYVKPTDKNDREPQLAGAWRDYDKAQQYCDQLNSGSESAPPKTGASNA